MAGWRITGWMMKLLDLFCGAGGAAMGYHQAGFDEIVGVDIEPQKRYPFEFVRADAFDYLARLIASGEIDKFGLIHASPRCQRWSISNRLHKKVYPDQITPLRPLLIESDRPYVIENIQGDGTPLINPLMLCGTMFGLRVIRHRLFETSPNIWFPPFSCNHWGKCTPQGRPPTESRPFVTVTGSFSGVEYVRRWMGIDWMVRDELSQAIPPAYTRWLGARLIELIGDSNA